MKAIVRMSAVAATAALTFGFGAAANAETVDCNDLTAEQKADLEYAAMGIISVPADLQKCVGQWDTPTGEEAAAAENDYSDAAEKEYNKNTQPEWDTPTRDEAAQAENDYLDAAEKEYNRLNEQNNAEMPSGNNGEEKVTDGEAGTSEASEGDNDGASEEADGATDKQEEKAAASNSGLGLARTGASVGILAALGAAATAVGGGVSYLRKRA